MRAFWESAHPYFKTGIVAGSASTMVVLTVLGGAMLFDLTDGEVKDWWRLWKFVAALWALTAVAIGAAFYNLRVLSSDQWAALDKLRKGELPTPGPKP